MANPPQYLRQAVEDTIGKKTSSWNTPDCGLSSAYRFSVLLEDKSRVFIKAATDEETGSWLRTEYHVLSAFKEDFIPQVVDWIDTSDAYPILITQDLSKAYWAASNKGVSWRKGDFDLLFDSVQKLSTVKGHPQLSYLKNTGTSIWTNIALNPTGFLNLKLCSKRWLNNSIDHLIEAEKRNDETGNTLVHGDIRSDNICINKSQVMFVDWSHAANGSPDHDLANLLPTLHLEGGPNPYQIMPQGASAASFICATHIRRLAKRNSMPQWLTNVIKKLIAIELDWAANCLSLDKPDGINWNTI